MQVDLSYNRKTVIDARKMDEKSKQLLRIRAYTLVRVEGKSPEAVAAVLGVSHGAVYKWLIRGDRFGAANLAEKPNKEKRRSERRRLTEEQEEQLKEIVTTGTPRHHGYSVILWSRALIADLILRKFGVKYHPNYVSQILKRMGLSAQKPVRISYRQSQTEVELWKSEIYPAISKRAQEEGAMILWGDESTMCASPNNGTTWAPRGETPVVRVLDSTEKVNVVGTLDNKGRSEFMVFQGSMNSKTFCTFIDEIMERYEGKIFLILDNASYHTSAETQLHISKYKDRLEVFFYPHTLLNSILQN